ncbi:Uncharacterised protein [uncultured archaeon]|nr:Uncharacterised protein [uncultured archaeon]
MILYTAGNMNPQVLAGMSERTNAKNWLETNAHKGSRDCADWFASPFCADTEGNGVTGFRLFIDSGAFTAWVKGKPIDHDAYIQYCKGLLETAVCPVVFASLDVIPGSLTGPPLEENDPEFARAAAAGWQNYLKEKAAGLKTIPTFHQGDPWEFLDLMMADTDYIGISPRKVAKTTAQKGDWLNQVFQRIDAAGKLPKPGNMHNAIKTHGLGVSSPVFMETFPFYSVDSTRWLQGGNGYFFFFDGHRIQLIFSTDWGGLHWSVKDKMHFRGRCTGEIYAPTSWTLSAIHHYRAPYQAKLVYYFHERGIRADAEMNAHIIEHWEARGVTWN